jgi:hypothetical protein
MYTLYALIFACLLLQACNGSSLAPTESLAINEHSTLREYIAAVSDGQDEEYVPPVATATIKPIEGAEFADTSHDTADTPWSMPSFDDDAIDVSAYLNDDGTTATIVLPGAASEDSDDFDWPVPLAPTRYYLVD